MTSLRDLDRHGATLRTIAATFPDRELVVIGAAALSWHFGESFRGTLDLDLCIAIDQREHASAAFPSTWRRVDGMPHRWRLDDSQLVDILPASESLLRQGELVWDDGTRLDLTGLDLAMSDHLALPASFPVTARVATRRALFVMKVAAWLDRPGDRVKDLGDLALLLDRHVESDDLRIFDDAHLDADREFDERAAFLLGVDLRAIVTARHIKRIDEFLQRVATPERPEHHWLLRAGPERWRADESTLPRITKALVAGLEAKG